MQELIVSRYGGFCFGVSRAVETLFSTVEQCDGPVFTYGQIIHNHEINRKLEQFHVKIVEDSEDIPAGSTVFLRTHGVTRAVLDALREKHVRIVDLTCPFVKKIHNIVENAGYVIIAGDRTHPEVLGIIGHCTQQPSVVSTLSELKAALDPRIPTAFVAQTTFRSETWQEMADYLRTEASDYVTVHPTICNATSDRQREVEQLAQQCDAMIIVGGKHSSNTVKLYEIARKHCDAYHIETFKELPSNLCKYQKIGLSAGASTPDSTIKEVINNMNNEKNVVANLEEEEFDFAQALESSLKMVRVGQMVKGILSVIGSNEVQLDLGTKHAGLIPMSEFSEEELAALKVGDEIEAFVMKFNDAEGTVLLSKKKLDAIKGMEKIESAFEAGEILTGRVAEAVKGGVIIMVNAVRVFVPATQATLRRDADLTALVGKDVRFRIIELDNSRRRRIIGSIKSVLKEERQAAEKEVWDAIEVGKKYTGVVKSLVAFGAFVDIGGVDGLIHITDLSWSKIKHPSEVLKEGDVVEVEVKAFNPETKRISLNFKKAEDDPWLILQAKYQEGDILNVKVLKLMTYGAFVSVIPGIDGLVHISQIANQRIEKVGDVLKVGDEYAAKLIEINYETKKVSLSIKAASADAQTEDAEAVEVEDSAE